MRRFSVSPTFRVAGARNAKQARHARHFALFSQKLARTKAHAARSFWIIATSNQAPFMHADRVHSLSNPFLLIVLRLRKLEMWRLLSHRGLSASRTYERGRERERER